MIKEMSVTPAQSDLRITLVWFALTDIALLIITAVVIGYLEIERPGSLSVTFVLLAAAVAGQRFVLREKRLPTARERWRLILASAAIALGVEVLFSVGLLMLLNWAEGGESDLVLIFQQLPVLILAIIAVVIALLMVGLCMLGYGPLTRMAHKKLVKLGKV